MVERDCLVIKLHRLWFCGLCFALRSGDEHRRLSRHQITLHKPVGDRAFLEYTEDSSKNNSGGLKDRKVLPKSVKYYENTTDPHRYFVRLYELYISKCPSDVKTDASISLHYLHPRETGGTLRILLVIIL